MYGRRGARQNISEGSSSALTNSYQVANISPRSKRLINIDRATPAGRFLTLSALIFPTRRSAGTKFISAPPSSPPSSAALSPRSQTCGRNEYEQQPKAEGRRRLTGSPSLFFFFTTKSESSLNKKLLSVFAKHSPRAMFILYKQLNLLCDCPVAVELDFQLLQM